MLCRINRAVPSIASNACKFLPSSSFSTVVKKKPLVERVKEIDTTLTEEQKVYVESLKKKLKGGINSPKSIYREVPTPSQVKGFGNFMPRMAENAEELIDYALSFIPKKTGPRRTRHKKRMEARALATRVRHKKLKEQRIAANERKMQKHKRIRNEVKAMWDQVNALRAKEKAIADFKAQNSKQ